MEECASPVISEHSSSPDISSDSHNADESLADAAPGVAVDSAAAVAVLAAIDKLPIGNRDAYGRKLVVWYEGLSAASERPLKPVPDGRKGSDSLQSARCAAYDAAMRHWTALHASWPPAATPAKLLSERCAISMHD